MPSTHTHNVPFAVHDDLGHGIGGGHADHLDETADDIPRVRDTKRRERLFDFPRHHRTQRISHRLTPAFIPVPRFSRFPPFLPVYVGVFVGLPRATFFRTLKVCAFRIVRPPPDGGRDQLLLTSTATRIATNVATHVATRIHRLHCI